MLRYFGNRKIIENFTGNLSQRINQNIFILYLFFITAFKFFDGGNSREIMNLRTIVLLANKKKFAKGLDLSKEYP